MKILFDITHPAHVHLFKNIIWNLEGKGHEILITSLDKDVTIKLLELYNIEYVATSNNEIFGLIGKWAIRDFEIYKIARKFNPDVLIGVLNPCVAHAATLLRKKSITFNDNPEVAKFAASITYPFTDTILVPSSTLRFKKDIGKKQVLYNGYHELAYLHPNYFKPNPEVLDELNLNKEDKFTLIRSVAWRAVHDIGKGGFSNENVKEIIKEIENYGQIFITSESKLHKDFEKYRINISPEKIHDALYYATMLIGDSQTMTTEASILGTPAIRCNSWVGPNDMSNFIELEKKYDLIYSFRDPNKALNKALELLKTPNLKQEWANKKERLLKDKIDVTAFMTWFIENYPESFHEMKENPNIQKKFA